MEDWQLALPLFISFSEHRRLTAVLPLAPVSSSCPSTPSIDLHRKSSASSIRLSVEPHESPNRIDAEQRAFRPRPPPQVHSNRRSGKDDLALLRFGSENVTRGVWCILSDVLMPSRWRCLHTLHRTDEQLRERLCFPNDAEYLEPEMEIDGISNRNNKR